VVVPFTLAVNLSTTHSAPHQFQTSAGRYTACCLPWPSHRTAEKKI